MFSTLPPMLLPVALCVGAFLLGAIPFGLMVGRWRGVDLREHGSKNIGATNTLRVLGKGPGIAVLLLDVAKGLGPVLVAKGLALHSGWIVGAGLCAMLGHIFSPCLGFKGGKGVATGLGVIVGLSPLVAAVSVVLFVLTVAVTRWVSLGSILGALSMAVLFFVLPAGWLTGDPWAYRLFGLLAATFVVVRHKANIERILQGTENRFGEKPRSTDATIAPSLDRIKPE